MRHESRHIVIIQGHPDPHLKQQGDRSMFVFGSANLSTTLIKNNLFDEHRLAVVPVILGIGRPLFEGGQSRQRLKLLGARPLSVGLRYSSVRGIPGQMSIAPLRCRTTLWSSGTRK